MTAEMRKVAIVGAPSENYRNAVAAQGMEPVETMDPALASACDGLLLPGGYDLDPELYGQQNHGLSRTNRELDEIQMQVCAWFVQSGKPVMGICRGHQLLNVQFGGTLIQHIPQVERHGWREEGDRVHGTVCCRHSFLSDLYGMEFPVNSAHHQALDSVPDCFLPLQYSDDGILEAMVHRSLPVFSVQWHPERMCGKLRRDDTVDGAVLFAWFRRVLEGTAAAYADGGQTC